MNSIETVQEDVREDLNRLQRRALLVGLVFIVACAGGALLSREQFFRSWLIGYVFWTGIALGSLALLMLHHLAGGSWGFAIQRILESGSRTLPVAGLLIVPIFLGLPDLYPWAHPEAVQKDELLRHKELYLNSGFFIIRTIFYFAVWGTLAWLLNKWSRELDSTGDANLVRRMQGVSAPGLVIYGLTATFAAVDWMMSLEPHWFSTMYGVIFIVGQVLSTLAFALIMLGMLSNKRPLSEVLGTKQFHDLGNLMLAFVMLWAYIGFSQFLIIWSANIKEETPWYLARIRGGWEWVALFLILFHFVAPFFILLNRVSKQRIRNLLRLAVAMLAIRAVDLFWLIIPAFRPARFGIHWMDFAALLGIGGVWIAAFAWQLRQRPLLPLQDPRMAEVFHHHE
jgi:hypothetical protein